MEKRQETVKLPENTGFKQEIGVLVELVS